MTQLTSLEVIALAGFVVNLLGLAGVFVQVGRVLSRLNTVEEEASEAHKRIDSILVANGDLEP